MKTLLFVDACMRGHEQSRTYGLCRHFIDEYLKTHPEFQLVHRDLTAGDLPQLTGPLSDQREEWPVTQPDDPLLSPAREVAGADVIVIGALIALTGIVTPEEFQRSLDKKFAKKSDAVRAMNAEALKRGMAAARG